jgi:hypothetical protein
MLWLMKVITGAEPFQHFAVRHSASPDFRIARETSTAPPFICGRNAGGNPLAWNGVGTTITSAWP